MIQLADIKKLEAKDIPKLVTLVQPELDRKKRLYDRYNRKIEESGKVKVPFEKYIVDIASGYLGGKEPTYEVEDTMNDDKKKLLKEVLQKDVSDDNYKEKMEILMNDITNFNDDGIENYTLVKDILCTGTAYEILYENDDNNYVYTRVSPLQTCAVWDFSLPRKLIGIVNIHNESDINTKIKTVVSLTDDEGTRTFEGFGGSYEETTETDEHGHPIYKNHNWGDVPYTVVETHDGTALFEPVIDLIDAYQELIRNLKETFKYNNDAKLKVTGYRPEQPLLTKNEEGKLVENEARKLEDDTLLKMRVFYTPDDGDIDWILKSVDDGATQNTLKTYIDLIMMITGVPQTTDLGFTKADNASAIDRKFFSLEQTTTQAMQQLKMAYKRRWELIFGRINLANGTKFDFRDIKITLNKNLPANENEVVDMYMKLRGLISDDTIIERLPLNLDSTSELYKMEEQDQKNLEKELNRATAMNGSGQEGVQENEEKETKINDKNKEENSTNKVEDKKAKATKNNKQEIKKEQ